MVNIPDSEYQQLQQLSEDAERYRSLVEQSVFGIGVALGNQVIFANRALLNIFCYDSFDEMKRVPLLDLVAPASRPMIAARMAAIERGEKVSGEFEYDIICKGGAIKTLRAHSSHLTLKGKLYSQTVFEDITDRERTAAALQESDLKLRKLAAQVPGMIYQFLRKPDGTYSVPYTSEGIRDIFGCSPDEVKDDFSPIAKVILPADAQTVINSIEYSAAHLTPWEIEYRVHVPGRPVRWMLGLSKPEKLADGGIMWYGYNTDITERKEAEFKLKEQLRQSKELSDATVGRELKMIELEKEVDLLLKQLGRPPKYSK